MRRRRRDDGSPALEAAVEALDRFAFAFPEWATFDEKRTAVLDRLAALDDLDRALALAYIVEHDRCANGRPHRGCLVDVVEHGFDPAVVDAAPADLWWSFIDWNDPRRRATAAVDGAVDLTIERMARGR